MVPVSEGFARSDLGDTRLGIGGRQKLGTQPDWFGGGGLEIGDVNFPTPLLPHGFECVAQSIRQDQVDRRGQSPRSSHCRNNYIERSSIRTERTVPTISLRSNNRLDV